MNYFWMALWVLLAIATLLMSLLFVTPAYPVLWHIVTIGFGLLNMMVTVAFGVLIHNERKNR